jgi:branched-chain amino acid transport system permease protein
LGWPIAMLVSAALALIVGVVSLRTRGVYFIMITLAFAQMVFYLFISLRQYGGEDGINLSAPLQLPGLNLADSTTSYYVVLVIVVGCLWLMNRVIQARFGQALQGIRENEARMEALGYPVFKIKLLAFVLAGAVAGLAGALLANHNLFVSPSLMHWTSSASLIIMVIVGGVWLALWRSDWCCGDALARRGVAPVYRLLAYAAGHIAVSDRVVCTAWTRGRLGQCGRTLFQAR